MNETSTQAHARAVVWIDHIIAKIFSVGLTGVQASAVRAHLPSRHLHHHANAIGSGRVREDSGYLARVSDALEGCTDLLIIGPGTEKTELAHHLQATRPDLHLSLEASDHPTDGELVALCRRHFRIGRANIRRGLA